MKIIIIATKTCHHRPLLERQFREIGISYTVQFVEDSPELIKKYAIQNSPNIVVDDDLVFSRNTRETVANYAGIEAAFAT